VIPGFPPFGPPPGPFGPFDPGICGKGFVPGASETKVADGLGAKSDNPGIGVGEPVICNKGSGGVPVNPDWKGRGDPAAGVADKGSPGTVVSLRVIEGD